LKNGILYKRNVISGEFPLRVVTNRDDQLELIWEAHVGDGGGHFEAQSTYLKLSFRFFWTKMRKMIFDFVQRCDDCQRMRLDRVYEPVTPSYAPSTIFLEWEVDIIIMPRSSDKKYALLHLVECLSGWSELQAFTYQDVEKMMPWVIDNVFRRYGYPAIIKGDQNSLTSVQARNIYDAYRINCKIITPHNHKGIGKGERAHAPIVAALSRYSRSNPKKWPLYLSLAAFADRVTTSYTGYSAYNVLFGQQPLLHLDFFKETFGIVNFRDGMSTDLIAARMRQLERRKSDLEILKSPM
jgi:hypothetical protein